ncbi:hypothetical protein TIFTF001_031037 [Ficus carica]|uniref:Uncharacterized protein n=1 Tax=Ficus carica TaxID=3494 RepID=A0AA88J5S9_FICCA|nr:hypothetical protein TIFTF001_031037 [Ficus carica]
MSSLCNVQNQFRRLIKHISPNAHNWLLSKNDTPQTRTSESPPPPKGRDPYRESGREWPWRRRRQDSGSRTLMETLSVPLMATSRLENVAVRIELSNGWCVWGGGEVLILPFVTTAEDQLTAMAKATEACQMLGQGKEMTLGEAFGEIAGILTGHDFASVAI